MDIERVKAAFIKADDLAQQGDKQAAEDAAEFARLIREHQATNKGEYRGYDSASIEGMGKNALGAVGGIVDFGQMIGSGILAGLGGIAKGAYSAAQGKDFLSNAAEGVEDVNKYFNFGNKAGLQNNPGYQEMNKFLGTPAEAGVTAMRGLGAISRLPLEGVEGAARHITTPESAPLSSTLEDTIGVLGGYGLVGGAMHGRANMGPELRPKDVPPTDQPAIKSARELAAEAELAKQQSVLDTPIPFSKEPMAILPDVPAPQGKGSFIKNNRTGEKLPFPREEVMPPLEMDPMAPYRGENMDVDTSRMSNMGKGRFMENAELPPDATREGGAAVERGQSLEDRNLQSDAIRAQEEQNKAAADYEARRVEFGEDPPLRTPQELALDYDPFSLKDLEKVPENLRLNEQERQPFDIDLLPERVSKDSVVKGHVTKYNRLLEEHNRLMDEARTQGLEATRIRNQELGKTKKSKEQLEEQAARLDKIKTQMDNLAKQLQRRMEVKHSFVYDEGWMGAPLYSGAKVVPKMEEVSKGEWDITGAETERGVYSEEPPSIAGPAERTPGLTVEKTQPPDMQRSPDANITGAAAVQKTRPHPLGGVGKKQGGALDLSGIGKSLGNLVKAGASVARHTVSPKSNAPKQKGFKGVDRIRKITGADSRDVDTFVSETIANKDMLTDIDPALSIRGAIRQDLTPSHVGKLSYAHNPIISYIMHNLDKIDGRIKMAKESALWGDKFGTNMWGHPKKMKSDDGARTIMDTLPKDRQEVLRETTMKYADGDILNKAGLQSPTDAMLSADGLNTREIQAYRAAEKQLDTLLNKLNTMLTKAGKQPIAKLAGYFPAVWKGDYRLFVKDGQGNTIKTLAFDHLFQMTEAEKKIKAADPTLTTEQFESQRDRYNLKDVSAFQLAAQSFPSNHPTAKLLDKIRSDIMSHRGAMKHGIQRKGVEGFMGSEKGDVAGMKQAMDIYLEQGYNFLADMEKQQFLEGVRTNFREKGYSLAEHLPNTDKYASDAVGNSIGALKNGLEMVDNVIEGITQIMAYQTGVGGKSTPKKAIRAMNGLAAFHYLATFKQYGLNLFQPVFSIPKALHATEGLKDRAMLMPHFMQAYMEAFVPKAMTASSKAALAYGKHTGMIDARTLELINSNAGSFMKKFGHLAAVFEQEAVRVPTYLFYDKILKDTIPDNKTRWDAAAQMTADSMVNYSKTQTPQVYQRAGLVGEATKSMQQFMHNYHGQLAEYMQLAMREKQFAPLIAFITAQWVIGGLTGVTPLIPINTLLGAFTGSKNSIQDWIEGSGMSDLWTMGPASKVTGLHLAESGSAPSIVPQPGAVGVELAMKMFSDLVYQADETKPGGLAVRAMQGVATSADKMQAAMTASPNLAKGFVEDIWKDPQGRIPNPKNKMIPDLPYKKEGWDEFTKNYLGAPSASEGAAKMRMRAMEDDMRGMEKQQAIYFRKLVSDFVDGQFNEEVFNKFIEKEGNPQKIKAAFKTAVIQRTMSKLQNEMVASGKWKRAQLMEKMQEYQIKMEKMPLQDLAEINR